MQCTNQRSCFVVTSVGLANRSFHCGFSLGSRKSQHHATRREKDPITRRWCPSKKKTPYNIPEISQKGINIKNNTQL